jgi:hypothetical protein
MWRFCSLMSSTKKCPAAVAANTTIVDVMLAALGCLENLKNIYILKYRNYGNVFIIGRSVYQIHVHLPLAPHTGQTISSFVVSFVLPSNCGRTQSNTLLLGLLISFIVAKLNNIRYGLSRMTFPNTTQLLYINHKCHGIKFRDTRVRWTAIMHQMPLCHF